jgi:AraC family transcriptional regulator
MEPRIEMLTEKKLVGKRMRISLSDNKTGDLWRSFMPRKKEVIASVNSDLFSLQVYDPLLNFKNFNGNTIFEKWAAIEVASVEKIPPGMETFILEGGLYAIFIYKGASSQFESMFRFIFGTWLPGSGYDLDARPHFEVLGEKYKNDDSASEEEIWIPIKMKE